MPRMDSITVWLSALALLASIVSVVYTARGYRLVSRRELRIEPQGVDVFHSDLWIVVHNLGERAETVREIRLDDGARCFVHDAQNLVIPAHDHRTVEINPELIKHEWGEDYPKLSPTASISAKAVSGSTTKTETVLDPALLLDGFAQAFVTAKHALGVE